jgi:hypothetical protein
MNTVRDIELLRDYPSTASKEFRDQIGRARDLRDQIRGTTSEPQPRGVDRSQELRPVGRPTIVRTVADIGTV